MSYFNKETHVRLERILNGRCPNCDQAKWKSGNSPYQGDVILWSECKNDGYLTERRRRNPSIHGARLADSELRGLMYSTLDK